MGQCLENFQIYRKQIDCETGDEEEVTAEGVRENIKNPRRNEMRERERQITLDKKPGEVGREMKLL